ncbi:histidine phosphatase family protein [Nanoarchaeota archaeon]
MVADKKFDVVFCSDLKRAIVSAELGFSDKYEIIQDERLRECDYGDLTEKPCSVFKNNMEEYVDKKFPNGESYKDVENRIRSFLDFLKENYEGKHVAIVAHEAPQLAINVIIEGRTWKESIDENWRKEGKWQPGWDYVLE